MARQPDSGGFFENDPTIFESLVENGCDVNIVDAAQATPLLYAVAESKVGHVERLLRLGARYDICNKDGSSPITLAAAQGYDRIVQILLADGDDVNRATQNGWTALHLVADDGDVATARVLLAHPVIDINRRERAGWTPLMLAARNGRAEVLKVLVEAGRIVERSIRLVPMHSRWQFRLAACRRSSRCWPVNWRWIEPIALAQMRSWDRVLLRDRPRPHCGKLRSRLCRTIPIPTISVSRWPREISRLTDSPGRRCGSRTT